MDKIPKTYEMPICSVVHGFLSLRKFFCKQSFYGFDVIGNREGFTHSCQIEAHDPCRADNKFGRLQHHLCGDNACVHWTEESSVGRIILFGFWRKSIVFIWKFSFLKFFNLLKHIIQFWN